MMRHRVQVADFGVVLAIAISLCLTTCNRAALRVPGVALSFPEVNTGFVAERTLPVTIIIAPPSDVRKAHYSDTVAGTRWEGCRTDTFWSDSATNIFQQNLNREIASSKLFHQPQTYPPPVDYLVLKSEIHAFCSQVVGFVFQRIAGIVAVKFSLVKNGKTVWQRQIEHVVTDTDPEYTGSQITFIEQAMRVAMSDSLRLVLRDLLMDLQRTELDSSDGDASRARN